MANTLISGVSLYLMAGLVVALLFLPVLGRIDHAARGVYAFRILLIPGATLLWPLVVYITVRALSRDAGGVP